MKHFVILIVFRARSMSMQATYNCPTFIDTVCVSFEKTFVLSMQYNEKDIGSC